jgi:hypothetical protein
VYVKPQGGTEVALASNYAFRSSHPVVDYLEYWAVIGVTGSHETCLSDTGPRMGDVNDDGKVDIIDLVIIAQNFNKSSGFYEGADQNNDGRVDIVDLVIVAQNFG